MAKKCSCGSQSFRRSRRKGLVEKSLFRLLRIKPYRCESCNKRCYRCRPLR